MLRLNQIMIAPFVCILLLAMPGPIAAAPATGDASIPQLGRYLSARVAAFGRDYDKAAEEMASAFEASPEEPHLAQQLLRMAIGAGDFEKALRAARVVEEMSPVMDEVAVNLLAIGDFVDGDYRKGLDRYQQSGIEIVPAFFTIVEAWMHFEDGDPEQAKALLQDYDTGDPLLPHIRFHQALIEAQLGNYASADSLVLSIPGIPNPEKYIPASLLGELLMLRTQLLAAQGKTEEVAKLAESPASGLPGYVTERLRLLHESIAGGGFERYDYIDGANEALSLFLSDISNNILASNEYELALIYARAASFLDPDNASCLLRIAGIFESLEGWRMAKAVYAAVPPADPLSRLARIRHANALYQLGMTSEALSAISELAETHPDDIDVQMMLGDFQRYESDFAAALDAYESVIAQIEPEGPGAGDGPSTGPVDDWTVFHFRAVSLERLGQWEESRREFERVLSLSGNNPYVLNYLGYTLADRNENLEEARRLIEDAVEQDPNNGAFIDSLGWVLFRMQDYEGAVEQLERAIVLEPHDPIVIDHLGDVYWMLGRKREARYQWRQALTFESEYADFDRISRKLEIGYEQLLAEEQQALNQGD